MYPDLIYVYEIKGNIVFFDSWVLIAKNTQLIVL